jgi:hypothetical protein
MALIVRLLAVIVVAVLFAWAQVDDGRPGAPRSFVPGASVTSRLVPAVASAQDDNENGNDNSDDDEDEGDNSDSGDNNDDGADNNDGSDGDNGDGDNNDGNGDDDNEDGGSGNDNDSGDDNENGNGNDNGNEVDDGDDNENGNDNDDQDNDEIENDNTTNDNDEDDDGGNNGPRVLIPVSPGSPSSPGNGANDNNADNDEPAEEEEPYLTEASATSDGGVAEARIGRGRVVVRMFPWLEEGITVTVRLVDPVEVADMPGGPVGDLVFVVEAVDGDGDALADLPVEVNVNVRYDDGEVEDLDEGRLVISRLDPATSQWQPAPKLLRDPVTNYLAVSITELGAYAVHAP